MAVTCDHECATSSTSAGDGIHDAESLSSLEINLSSEMTVQNGGEDDIYSPAPVVDLTAGELTAGERAMNEWARGNVR